MGSIAATGAWIAANAGTIAAVGTAAAAGTAAYEAHAAGVASSNAAKQKARVESLNAKQQQITMRQNMMRALASQNAGTLGGIGTGPSTSFGANARRQLNEEQNDLLISKANSSAQVSLLDQAANNARSQGNIEGAGDIFSGAAKVAGV